MSVLKLMHGHPSIIKLLSTFNHNSKVFMVFELMQQTLLEMIQNEPEGKLDHEKVRKLVYQMVKALAHMHNKNAVHRDIKPENMLISQVASKEAENNAVRKQRGHSVEAKHENQEADEGVYILKICDFGQARYLSQNEKDTNLTEYVSTRWYRAPELLIGSKFYDKSIDIWALGCIIPEMISGRPLFPGNTNYEALAYILKTLGNGLTQEQTSSFHQNQQFSQFGRIPNFKKVVSLNLRVPELTNNEIDFIQQCLAIDPLKRSTAEQLLNHPYLFDLNSQLSKSDENTPQNNSNYNQDLQDHQLKNSFHIVPQYREVETSQIKDTFEIEQTPQKQSEGQIQSSCIKNRNFRDSQGRRCSEINKRTKKRASSSNNNNTENKHSNEISQNDSSPSHANSRQNKNREESDKEDAKQSESNQESSQQQLPKPILFLRKQKDTREIIQKDDDKELQKAINLSKNQMINESPMALKEKDENPFEITQLVEQKQSNTQIEVGKQRISVNQQSIYDQKMYRNESKKGTSNLLQPYKQSTQKQNQLSNPNLRERNSMKPQNNQIVQIPKNQITFKETSKQVSPPIKSTNHKLLMVSNVQYQHQQQQQQQQQENVKFQKLRINKHRQSLPYQQRNASVQQQQEDKQHHNKNMQSKGSNEQYLQSQHVYQYSPNPQLTSKQKTFLPKIIQEKRIADKQNNVNQNLLNTQKHVTSKLQLPNIAQTNNNTKNHRESFYNHINQLKKNLNQDQQQLDDTSISSLSRNGTQNEKANLNDNTYRKLSSKQEHQKQSYSQSPHCQFSKSNQILKQQSYSNIAESQFQDSNKHQLAKSPILQTSKYNLQSKNIYIPGNTTYNRKKTQDKKH